MLFILSFCGPTGKLLKCLRACGTIKAYVDNKTKVDTGCSMNQTHHALVLLYVCTLQKVMFIMLAFS